MELRLLGPVEIVTQDGPVPIPAGKPRALLVLLALNANEPIDTDRIIDALWGEAPPTSAPAIVQTYVSRLRKLLGEDRIETVGRGYRLLLAPGEKDVDRVEELRERSRTEAPIPAARSLREAAALFRGRPLADVADYEFAQAEARHLEELRPALVTERIEADLAAGRHADVLAELGGLVASRPLDERLRGLEMLALYRSGRQADALATYQDARRALTDELGLEPSDELKALQRQILEHDPSLGQLERLTEVSVERGAPIRRRWGLIALVGTCVVVVAAGVAGGLAVADRGATAVAVAANSVAVIDPEERQVVANVPVGRRPLFVAATADSVWVAAVEDRTLTQIEPETYRVVATVGLGFEPTDIEAVGTSVWVAGGYDHALWRVDRDGIARVKLRFRERFGPSPPGFERGRAGLASSKEGLWLSHGSEVTLLDPVSGKARGDVAIGSRWADDIDVGAMAIIENVESGYLQSFNPSTLEVGPSLFTGRDVSDIVIASGSAWIAKWVSDAIWQVDELGLTLRRTIDVEHPLALAFLDDTVWATSRDESLIWGFSASDGHVVASIELEHTPDGIAAAHGLLWVAVRKP